MTIVAAFLIFGMAERAKFNAAERLGQRQRWIERALESLQNGDLDGLETAIMNAKDVGARGELMDILDGRVLLGQRDLDGAMELFETAMNRHPKSVAPVANLALALSRRHQLDDISGALWKARWIPTEHVLRLSLHGGSTVIEVG